MTNTEPRTADRPSSCPDCFGFIQVGDQVTRDNAFDEWHHLRCPPTKYDFDPNDVCGTCFTVRSANGKCAC